MGFETFKHNVGVIRSKFATYKAAAPMRRAAQLQKVRDQIAVAQEEVLLAKEKAKLAKLRGQGGGSGFMNTMGNYFQGVAENSKKQTLTGSFGPPMSRRRNNKMRPIL